MAAQLRLQLYGSALANFGPGYPSKQDAMRNYIYFLEEQYRLEETDRLNPNSKKTVRDNFVTHLREHWGRQPDPKPLLETEQVNDKVKPLIAFYWKLKDKKAKLNDLPFIERETAKLSEILDIEKKSVSKKRPIQEVRNYKNSKSVLDFKVSICQQFEL